MTARCAKRPTKFVLNFLFQDLLSPGQWTKGCFDPFCIVTEPGKTAPLRFDMSSLKPLETGARLDLSGVNIGFGFSSGC